MGHMERMEIERTHAFLSDLETKGFDAAVRFSGYGGSGYGAGYWNSAFPWLQMRPPGAKYDYQVEAGDLWRNTVAAIAFGWIKKNVTEARPCVKRRKADRTYDEVMDHAIETVLETPNPFYDLDALLGATAVSWFGDGNAYWIKGQNIAGQTGQLWYVPHWQMRPVWDSDGQKFISGYLYTVDGKPIPLRPDQVVHFRNGLDPRNYRYGFSELACAVREVCTDNEAANYCAAIVRNMGVVGLMISPESENDTIEEDDRKAMKETFRSEFTGDNRGGVMINSVRLKVDPINVSPDKMALDQIRRVPEARICAAIGLRPTVLGLTTGEDQKNYRNGEQDRRAAYEDCLKPFQKKIGRQFTRQCPEIFQKGECLGWDYSEVPALQEDQTEKVKRTVVAVGGPIMTPNEGRAAMGLPPIADGDKLNKQMEKGTQPMIGDNRVGDKAA